MVAVRDIAVGIMVYNEAANIGRALRSIQRQTIAARINRILVVASGCTDDTCAIVNDFAATDSRIALIVEPLRTGKTVAINRFLSMIHEPIVVLPSGDLILEPETLDHLVQPLADSRVGMVGAHPIPTNEDHTFLGFAVHLMWELHDRIASVAPKMGELVAFRNQVFALNPTLLADELAVEHQIRKAGLRVVYARKARVFNTGPRTLREFVAQRERWLVSNMQTAHELRLCPSTLSISNVLRAVKQLMAEKSPRADWLLLAAALEALCRVRAYVGFTVMRRANRYQVWESLASTKTVTPERLC